MSGYDAIVVGLGAMGSATAYHLAAGGARVLGLDRYHPPHELGSSHGLTRIIREAYFEDPAYVPLVQRAYELWAELEKASERQLFIQTGGVMVGPSTGVLVSGARRSAEQHHLQHEVLSSAELHRRFPVFEPQAEMNGVWEPRAGVLFPELAIQSHLGLASKSGAELHFNEPVLKWEADGEGVRVQTESATYTAAKLVVSAGPWATSLMPGLALPLTVERQVLYWFDPSSQAALFRPPSCPIYIWEYGMGKFFYGFPDLGDGIKVAMHHQGPVADPSKVEREVRAEEVERMREVLKRFMPAAAGRLRATAACLYTNTPDEHFILDRHPLYPQVVVVSPCSGHGFKFSSVVGEVATALVCDKEPEFDLNLFRIGRFART